MYLECEDAFPVAGMDILRLSEGKRRLVNPEESPCFVRGTRPNGRSPTTLCSQGFPQRRIPGKPQGFPDEIPRIDGIEQAPAGTGPLVMISHPAVSRDVGGQDRPARRHGFPAADRAGPGG